MNKKILIPLFILLLNQTGFGQHQMGPAGGDTSRHIHINPAFLDFGFPAVGVDIADTIRISNTSSGSRDVSVQLTAPHPPFYLSSPASFTLTTGQTNFIIVHFKPIEANSYKDSIIVHSNAYPNAAITIPLSAWAHLVDTVHAAISAKSFDFGTVPAGKTDTMTFTLKNVGDTLLPMHGRILQPNLPFVVTKGGGPFLIHGQTHVVSVAFIPSQVGDFRDSFLVTTNSVDSNSSIMFLLHGISNQNGVQKITSDPIGVTLSPNPAQNILNIALKTFEDDQPRWVQIWDAVGRPADRTSVVTINTSKLSLDISKLAAGHYYLRVTTQKGETTEQFVIER